MGADIEVTEFRLKNNKIRHKIEVNGKDYQDIRYRGSYGQANAHGLNYARYDMLLNSLMVGLQATNGNSNSNSGGGTAGDPRRPPKTN
jgi:hypothetical protein